MSADQLQDHRIDTLEKRVESHGRSLDDLHLSVTALSTNVETTNSLLRESLTLIKKGAAGIMALTVAVFGAGQVMP